MEEFNFINKDRTRAKVFKLFKDLLSSYPFIEALEISYRYVYKRAN